jgi:beta-glucosidase-like glycosyl hydrolase
MKFRLKAAFKLKMANLSLNRLDRDLRLLSLVKEYDPGFELSVSVRKTLQTKLDKEVKIRDTRHSKRTPLPIESREIENGSPRMEYDYDEITMSDVMASGSGMASGSSGMRVGNGIRGGNDMESEWSYQRDTTELDDLRRRLLSIESRKISATGSVAALLTWDVRFDAGK